MIINCVHVAILLLNPLTTEFFPPRQCIQRTPPPTIFAPQGQDLVGLAPSGNIINDKEIQCHTLSILWVMAGHTCALSTGPGCQGPH